MNILILPLAISEIDGFLTVFQTVLSTQFPGYTPKVVEYMFKKAYTKESYNYWIKNGYKTVMVAKNNEQTVGFIVIDQPYGGVSFCRWLGILKQYQKQGIGTSLINQWTELAKKEGAHKLEVAGQPEAKGFYEKVGLDLEGHRKFSYFGIDQFIFGKVIGIPTDEVMTKY